jgi:hypothetical protein
MRNSQLGAIVCLVALSLACTPLVRSDLARPGPKVSADCFKVGEGTIVSLSIQRKEGSASWKAEFIGDSPENLTIEDIPNLTIIKWKMDTARTKEFSIKPYKINIQNGENSYEVAVSFASNSQQFISALAHLAPLH